jgi:hypothetical protein
MFHLMCGAACLYSILAAAPAQPGTQTAKAGHEIFVSWGYNGDHYTKSDLHIHQPSIGNDFTLGGVQARDSSPWGNILGHSLFVPQYNVRAGVFFNERWGLEVALDHMKWIVEQDQVVPLTGTLNAAAVDTDVTLTTDVLRYQLNNGANPVFINAVRRIQLRGEPKRTGSISFLAKAGGGPAMPHTQNELFGQPNDSGFQFFHGWDVDAAAAIRVHVFKRLYIEAEDKLVYARYFGVKVDRGTAGHSIKANEFIVTGGMSFK